jgi:hypothetical protein
MALISLLLKAKAAGAADFSLIPTKPLVGGIDVTVRRD